MTISAASATTSERRCGVERYTSSRPETRRRTTGRTARSRAPSGGRNALRLVGVVGARLGKPDVARDPTVLSTLLFRQWVACAAFGLHGMLVLPLRRIPPTLDAV